MLSLVGFIFGVGFIVGFIESFATEATSSDVNSPILILIAVIVGWAIHACILTVALKTDIARGVVIFLIQLALTAVAAGIAYLLLIGAFYGLGISDS